MIGAGLAFAAMGVCIKLAAERHVPLGQIVFYRCFVSLVLIFLYLRVRGLPIRTKNWKAHLSRSTSGAIAMVTMFAAITLLPLATAITLQYTSPLFVALALLLSGRERPQWSSAATLIFGFAGVALLLRPVITVSLFWGAALAVASALATAVSVMNMRILGELREPSGRTVFYFSLFATVALLPWFIATNPFSNTDVVDVLQLLGVGTFATVGQLMITFSYQRGKTLLSANLGYAQVVFASIFGIFIWHDMLSLASWIAIAIIVASGVGATALVRAR
jgi:drug/metabolite transporter (DMT)-like permease